ncbi:MAG: PHP domain-containing protein [Clostridiaceae bacterium]|nr:PHP domain-containing protein [Clostridiaceae bacterium]
MKVIADYHTHTYYSDGHNSCRDMVARAKELGLEEYAITDHGYATNLLGLSRRSRLRQKEKLLRLEDEFGIRVLKGIEANILTWEGLLDLREEEFEEFDIVQFGFHRPLNFWTTRQFFTFVVPNFSKKGQDIEKNTRALINAMERYPLKIVSHPNNVLAVDTVEIAKAAVRLGIRFELNEKHWDDVVDTLKAVSDTGVGFILGSDSHRASAVAQFPNVLRIIEEAGIPVDRIKGLSV